MKEIVLDTETTGLSVRDGHRIVEIGCINDNLVPTKNIFHFYLNPERKFQRKLLRFMDILMSFYQLQNLQKLLTNF